MPKKSNGEFTSGQNPFLKLMGSYKDMHAGLDEVHNLAEILDNIVRSGCAIMFGETRDGGAMVITILDGDNRHRTYCHDVDEVNKAFEVMAEMYPKK